MDVSVFLAGEFVDKTGGKAMLGQHVTPPHLVERM
jgi:hypothetical protein